MTNRHLILALLGLIACMLPGLALAQSDDDDVLDDWTEDENGHWYDVPPPPSDDFGTAPACYADGGLTMPPPNWSEPGMGPVPYCACTGQMESESGSYTDDCTVGGNHGTRLCTYTKYTTTWSKPIICIMAPACPEPTVTYSTPNCGLCSAQSASGMLRDVLQWLRDAGP